MNSTKLNPDSEIIPNKLETKAPERQRGLWSFLTWSFLLAQVFVAEQFIGSTAQASTTSTDGPGGARPAPGGEATEPQAAALGDITQGAEEPTIEHEADGPKAEETINQIAGVKPFEGEQSRVVSEGDSSLAGRSTGGGGSVVARNSLQGDTDPVETPVSVEDPLQPPTDPGIDVTVGGDDGVDIGVGIDLTPILNGDIDLGLSLGDGGSLDLGADVDLGGLGGLGLGVGASAEDGSLDVDLDVDLGGLGLGLSGNVDLPISLPLPLVTEPVTNLVDSIAGDGGLGDLVGDGVVGDVVGLPGTLADQLGLGDGLNEDGPPEVVADSVAPVVADAVGEVGNVVDQVVDVVAAPLDGLSDIVGTEGDLSAIDALPVSLDPSELYVDGGVYTDLALAVETDGTDGGAAAGQTTEVDMPQGDDGDADTAADDDGGDGLDLQLPVDISDLGINGLDELGLNRLGTELM